MRPSPRACVIADARGLICDFRYFRTRRPGQTTDCVPRSSCVGPMPSENGKGQSMIRGGDVTLETAVYPPPASLINCDCYGDDDAWNSQASVTGCLLGSERGARKWPRKCQNLTLPFAFASKQQTERCCGVLCRIAEGRDQFGPICFNLCALCWLWR